MKHIIRNTLLSVMLLGSMPAVSYAAETDDTGYEVLLINQGTNVFIHNGVKIGAAQPSVVKKGVTYVAAKSIMKELYGTVSYDGKKKQYVLQSGDVSLRFTVNSAKYSVNGSAKTAPGAAYIQQGTLMVPLKTVAAHFGMTLTNLPRTKQAELRWSVKPVAKFSISDVAPYAKDTIVAYKDEASLPLGSKIVEERWENRVEVFDEPGTYTVTRWVKNDKGVWSDPYSVVVNVKPQNQPPVALFYTDKSTYMMGEYIWYIDQSTDDEDRIVSTDWTNAQPAFFQPGEQTITLRVTDAHGKTSDYTRKITITDELLYTKEQFDLRYTPIGDKFPINGSQVLEYQMVSYDAYPDGEMMLFRENSPEAVVEEGIYYASENVLGNVRLMLHNDNKRSTPVQAYVIATNTGKTEVNATLGPIGIGGPSQYVSLVGKAAVGKYLSARESGVAPKVLTIAPGESRVLFTEISNNIINPGKVYSLYADVTFDEPVTLQIAYIDKGKDIFQELPGLPMLEMKGHVRGTFHHANRALTVNNPVGDERGRLIIGDGKIDPRLYGVDEVSYKSATNTGNYGVLYKLTLKEVKPNTAILINPRGGFYAGAFSVNGRVVYTTSNTIISNANEAVMLHRTGNQSESVTITFVPASGSNLPINLLFVPLDS